MKNEEEVIEAILEDDDPAMRLSMAVARLEPDAIRVLAFIAERLVVGRECYTDLVLATDSRDMAKEQSQEIGDLLVYFAMERLKDVLKRALVKKLK